MIPQTNMNSYNMIDPARKKRRYGKLSLDQKIEIIRAAELGFSQRTLASQYNCGKTQVHLLITQKDMWLAQWKRLGKPEPIPKIRDASLPFPDVNIMVWDFFKKARLNNVSVTGQMLKQRAIQVSETLGCKNFNPTEEWLQNFTLQYDISTDESDSENSQAISLMQEFCRSASENSLTMGYDLKDIVNFGMIELRYRSIPCLSRNSKEKLTMCVSSTAAGHQEIRSIVLPENDCEESELWNVTVPCFSSPNGDVTAEVYEHTVNILNEEMLQQSRQIVLLVDEAKFPPELVKKMSNIRIETCPQLPIHHGILEYFKLLYYRKLLSSLLANSNEWDKFDFLVSQLPMYKIMRIVQSSWTGIPIEVVQNSFSHCGLFKKNLSTTPVESNIKLSGDIVELLQLVNKNLNGPFQDVELFVKRSISELDKPSENDIKEEKSSSSKQVHEVSPINQDEALSTIDRLESLLLMLTDPSNPLRLRGIQLFDELGGILETAIIQQKSVNQDLKNVDN